MYITITIIVHISIPLRTVTGGLPTSDSLSAMPTTTQSVAARPANSFTNASSVGMTTLPKTI